MRRGGARRRTGGARQERGERLLRAGASATCDGPRGRPADLAARGPRSRSRPRSAYRRGGRGERRTAARPRRQRRRQGARRHRRNRRSRRRRVRSWPGRSASTTSGIARCSRTLERLRLLGGFGRRRRRPPRTAVARTPALNARSASDDHRARCRSPTALRARRALIDATACSARARDPGTHARPSPAMGARALRARRTAKRRRRAPAHAASASATEVASEIAGGRLRVPAGRGRRTPRRAPAARRWPPRAATARQRACARTSATEELVAASVSVSCSAGEDGRVHAPVASAAQGGAASRFSVARDAKALPAGELAPTPHVQAEPDAAAVSNSKAAIRPLVRGTWMRSPLAARAPAAPAPSYAKAIRRPSRGSCRCASAIRGRWRASRGDDASSRLRRRGNGPRRRRRARRTRWARYASVARGFSRRAHRADKRRSTRAPHAARRATPRGERALTTRRAASAARRVRSLDRDRALGRGVRES